MTIHRERRHTTELATQEKAVVKHFTKTNAWATNAVYRDILITCSVSDDHTWEPSWWS